MELAHRLGYDWNQNAPRLFFGEKHWREPLRWNQRAQSQGERERVFCGSMCDILDTWQGEIIYSGAPPAQERARKWWGTGWPQAWGARPVNLNLARELLWELIDATYWLDWLLLTKRPQDYRKMLPRRWLKNPRPNVWIMTTVESREYLWRLDAIAAIPAVVHGVSWEPALGYINFIPYAQRMPSLWVIGGGESCAGCRPFDPNWARLVREDLAPTHTPFFLKQLGGHPDKQDKPARWPPDLRVQQFPVVS
jgi:hypothetical protein